jgi:hypothetical protein
MPSRFASGAWMSALSWASSRRSASGRRAAARIRTNCRASRISTTRKSRMIASNSRRKPSALLRAPAVPLCACSDQTFSASRWPSTSKAIAGVQSGDGTGLPVAEAS